MIKMIVKGQQLDLFREEVFAVSKAVSKLGEFDLRHGDVSVNFSVPATAKNVAIFGNLFNLNNFNKTAFNRFDGFLKQDESILSNGYFRVLNINPSKHTIGIRFYGGNSDWFNLINKRDINGTYLNTDAGANTTTYSLQSLNHKFEPDVVNASFSNEEGYFYFPVDNGRNSDKLDNVLSIQDFQIGVFQHTIFKKIFDSIGIKLNGTLFNDPLYYNTLINKPSDFTGFDKQNTEKRFTPKTQPLIGTAGLNVPVAINFDQSDFDSQWNGTLFTSAFDTTEVTFFSEIITDIDPTFWNLVNARIHAQVFLNGVSLIGAEELALAASNDDGGFLYFTYGIVFDGGTYPVISEGDTVEFRYLGSYSASGGSFIDVVKNNGNNGSFSNIKYTIDGAIIPYDITNSVPKINQADFVKDVMFRHGVISQYDSKTRTLTLDKFQDIDTNRPLAVDYSDKIDLLTPPVYDFTKVLTGFKKTSRITYVHDDKDNYLSLFRAIFKRGVGDAVIEIDNDNLSGEAVIYESPFSATSQGYSWNNNFYIPQVQVFKIDGVTDDVTPASTYEPQELNARIFVKAGNISVSSINSGGYDSVNLTDFDVIPSIGYAYFAKQQLTRSSQTNKSLNLLTETLAFENINQSSTNYIGRTLLEKNYNLYFNILKNPVHLSINLNLKALDIQELDFLKPVFLNFSLDSGYYYINNVSQYKGDGSTTRVELVKI